jgi:hypothetical protein
MKKIFFVFVVSIMFLSFSSNYSFGGNINDEKLIVLERSVRTLSDKVELLNERLENMETTLSNVHIELVYLREKCGGSNNNLDELKMGEAFEKYSNCFGINRQVLMQFSGALSGNNPDVSFGDDRHGLFLITEYDCSKKMENSCGNNIFGLDVNMYVSAYILDDIMSELEDRRDMTERDKLSVLYYGWGAGGFAMKEMLNSGGTTHEEMVNFLEGLEDERYLEIYMSGINRIVNPLFDKNEIFKKSPFLRQPKSGGSCMPVMEN